MKIIVDLEKKTLKMLENERSIFRGEKSADKLELYINKQLENEYPTITGLLSNGRKIGAYSADSYEIVELDGVQYTKAEFTLSKENGFTLSEGKMQITIWMNSNGKKEALGNVTLNVINTTAYDDGDIIVSGDVEGTIVNFKVELENLQSQINLSTVEVANLKNQLGNIKWLGATNQEPSLVNNTFLNSVTTTGLYAYDLYGMLNLMTVDVISTSAETFVTQHIFKTDRVIPNETISNVEGSKTHIIRTLINGVWTTKTEILATENYVEEIKKNLEAQTYENYYAIQNVKFTLNNKADKSYVEERIASLVGSAPETLDTLDEIAEALKDNEDIVDVLNQSIATKADKKYVDDMWGNLNIYDYTYSTNPYVENDTLYLENVTIKDGTLMIRNGKVIDGTLYL